MPPIAITFHTTPPTGGGPLSKINPFPQPSSHSSKKRSISTNSRIKHSPSLTSASPLWFTITPAPAITPSHGLGGSLDPASNLHAGSASPAQAKPSRRKPQSLLNRPESSSIGKTASLTPLLQPIVTRCLAKPSSTTSASFTITATGPGSSFSTPLHSPPAPGATGGTASGPSGKKTLGHSSSTKKKPTVPHPPTTTWPIIHPYSRAVDTKNDRSTVPSPREVARAQQLEVDRIKAREENAAAARAAAAAKRRKGGKSRTGSRNGNGANGAATRSQSPSNRDRDREEKEKDRVKENNGGIPTITTEAASKESSPVPSSPGLPAESTPAAGAAVATSITVPNPLPPRAGLKRTRSTGLGISTNVSNILSGGPPAVSSPLRAVTGPLFDDPEDEDHPADGDSESLRIRKRSRLSLSDASGVPTGKTRATTASPTSSSSALPVPAAGDSTTARSEPLPHAKPLPPRRASGTINDSTAMRRAISATTFGQGGKKMTRTPSTGSADGSAARERARREVTLPGRLRDYDMRAGGAIV